MAKTKNNFLTVSGGALTGLINGLLGAGGGMLAVPFLEISGIGKKQAHASAVAVIMPLSLLSAVLYLLNGSVTAGEAVKYVPWGLIGAAAGTYLLKKLPDKWIRRLFALFMIWAGVRIFMR